MFQSKIAEWSYYLGFPNYGHDYGFLDENARCTIRGT